MACVFLHLGKKDFDGCCKLFVIFHCIYTYSLNPPSYLTALYLVVPFYRMDFEVSAGKFFSAGVVWQLLLLCVGSIVIGDSDILVVDSLVYQVPVMVMIAHCVTGMKKGHINFLAYI